MDHGRCGSCYHFVTWAHEVFLEHRLVVKGVGIAEEVRTHPLKKGIVSAILVFIFCGFRSVLQMVVKVFSKNPSKHLITQKKWKKLLKMILDHQNLSPPTTNIWAAMKGFSSSPFFPQVAQVPVNGPISRFKRLSFIHTTLKYTRCFSPMVSLC